MSCYQYEGTIAVSSKGCREIILEDVYEPGKPPAALRVPCRDLAAYLEARGYTDEEERYLTQLWIFDRNLFLQAVVIPGDNPGIPAKVIACADPDRLSDEIVIFGLKGLLSEEHPKSMSRDAFHEWLEHRRRFGLHPVNQ